MRLLACLGVLAATVISGCPWDNTGVDGKPDGKIVVACVGDSNTAHAMGRWCSELDKKLAAEPLFQQFFARGAKDADADLHFATYARNGATAATRVGPYPGGFDRGDTDGLPQLAAAMHGRFKPCDPVPNDVDSERDCAALPEWDKQPVGPADVIVLALGSNDMNAENADPVKVWKSIEALWRLAEAEGRVVYVAKIPPRFDVVKDAVTDARISCAPSVALNQRIEVLNQLISANVPGDRVLDFYKDVTCDHIYDGIHMNDNGIGYRTMMGFIAAHAELHKFTNPTP